MTATFGIILSIEGLATCDLRRFRPPRLFDVTETKPDSEVLALDRVKHRKYGAQLSLNEARRLIDRYSLRHDGDGTSVGAPGTGYVLSDAAVFIASPVDVTDAWVEAWITPVFSNGPATKEMFEAAIASLKETP